MLCFNWGRFTLWAITHNACAISQAFGSHQKSSLCSSSRRYELPEFFSFLPCPSSPPPVTLISLMISPHSALPISSSASPFIQIVSENLPSFRPLLDRSHTNSKPCQHDPWNIHRISMLATTTWRGPAPPPSKITAVASTGLLVAPTALFPTSSLTDPFTKRMKSLLSSALNPRWLLESLVVKAKSSRA